MVYIRLLLAFVVYCVNRWFTLASIFVYLHLRIVMTLVGRGGELLENDIGIPNLPNICICQKEKGF